MADPRSTRAVGAVPLALAAIVAIAGAAPDDEKEPKVVAAPEAKNHVDRAARSR